MEQTNRPILMVWRSNDSSQHLSGFLETIQILSELNNVPDFQVWIISESGQGAKRIYELIESVPAAARLRRRSELVVWGDLGRAAMLKSYSQALFVVIPGIKASFHHVAVDAMACGCPVVMAQLVDLVDVVLDGQSGNHYPEGDPLSLAAIACGYLRNPFRREEMGNFAKTWAHGRHQKIAASEKASSREEVNALRWQKDYLPLLAEELGQSVCVRKLIGTKENLAAIIEWDNQVSLVKIFQNKLNEISCLFGAPSNFNNKINQSQQLGRTLFHADNPCAQKVIRLSRRNNFVIHEVAPGIAELAEDPFGEQALRVVRHAEEMISHYGTSRHDPALAAKCAQGGHLFPQLIRNIIYGPLNDNLPRLKKEIIRYDALSAQLNGPLSGGENERVISHPAVELGRITLGLICKHWPLPQGMASRFLWIVIYLSRQLLGKSLACGLSHGALGRESVRQAQGRLAVTDWEKSGFVFGDLDTAVYAGNILTAAADEMLLKSSLDFLRRRHAQWSEFIASAAWLAIAIIHKGLWAMSCGKRNEADSNARLLKDFAWHCEEVRLGL